MDIPIILIILILIIDFKNIFIYRILINVLFFK